jgi:predicted phage tail protein
LIKITLLGMAARICGKEHILDILSPKEAMSALCNLYPAFKAYMYRCAEAQQYFRVIPDRNWKGITEEELSIGLRESLFLVPVISGGGGFLKIVAGVLLIGLGLLLGPATLFGGFLIKAAIGLALSGVASLFAPHPQTSSLKPDVAQKKSNYFTGPSQASGQGLTIPLPYGLIMLAGIPVSRSIDSQPL